MNCGDGHLVPLRNESGALIGRVGLSRYGGFRDVAVVLHGVHCGEFIGLAGLVLARQNNQDALRTRARVAGSPAAWSKWAEQVLDEQQDLEIELLLRLHPLLRDHDLRVWRFGTHVLTLNDLVVHIVASDELRVHLGEVSHEDYDDVGCDRFRSVFKLSDELVIVPKVNAPDRVNREIFFPWLLDVAPIDYKSRLEAALTGYWRGFEKDEEDDAVVGEVDGIEICRSVTLYRRMPTG